MTWPKCEGSICPQCGQPAITVVSDPIEQAVGGRSCMVEGFQYNRCAACGEVYLAGSQIDDIARAANAAVRKELGRLSGFDIATIRRSLGLTQKGLAERLAVSPGLVARWERDTVLPSGMADRYLRDLSAHPELVDRSELIAHEQRGPYRPRSR